MNKKVAIIILNWNGWEDSIECLESLYQITYLNYYAIVVDNGSKNNSIDKIKEYCEGKIELESKFFDYDSTNKPIKVVEYTRKEAENIEMENDNLPSNQRLILIKNEINYGFAEGNNIAIKYALKALNPDYVLLLNNDTVVDKEFLSELVKVSESNEMVGIVGPNIYYYDEPKRLWASGDQKTVDKIDNSQYNDIKEVKFVVGCAFFIKASVIYKVGLLDSDLFLYGEDDDYCMRVRKAGPKLYFSPCSIIWHKASLQGDMFKPYQVYYSCRNSIILRRKNYPGIRFYFSIFLYLLINIPFHLINFLKSGRYNLIIPMLIGLIDGFLWCLCIVQAGENRHKTIR